MHPTILDMANNNRTCFTCKINLSYLNQGGYANCGSWRIMKVDAITDPKTAENCRGYREIDDSDVAFYKNIACNRESEDKDSTNYDDIDSQYQFAYNENNEIIDISKIDTEYRKIHSFHCISCGKEMSAHLKDDKRKRHFQHTNKCNCSFESYIHLLAKEIFKKRYDSADKFILSYRENVSCNNTNCLFRHDNCNNKQIAKEIDLKEYFPVCTIEKDVEGQDDHTYRADVLLSNPNQKKYKLLVEINNTHECSENKKEAGLHIVEIDVKSEEQARNIGKDNSLLEGQGVTLHGFNSASQKLTSIIYRYVHIPNVKSFVLEIPCSKQGQTISAESDVEIDFIKQSEISNEQVEKNFNRWLYLGIKNCSTCSHKRITDISCECDKLNLSDCNPSSCKYYIGNFQETGCINENSIKYNFIKGEAPKYYSIFIHGPHKLFNIDVVSEHIEQHINSLRERNNIMLITSDNEYFIASVIEAADNLEVPFSIKHIDWEQYNKRAAYVFVYNVINDESIDKVIVFTNGTDGVCNKAVELASSKNKLLANIDLTKIDNICPKCGSSLELRNGRYGMFWGCSDYPECDYKRKY